MRNIYSDGTDDLSEGNRKSGIFQGGRTGCFLDKLLFPYYNNYDFNGRDLCASQRAQHKADEYYGTEIQGNGNDLRGMFGGDPEDSRKIGGRSPC